MNVGDLMTTHVETCTADDTVESAARRMWDADCGALPVVQADGVLIGMITDRDICMASWSRGKRCSELRVGDVMTPHPRTVAAFQATSVAELAMSEYQLHRLPVVDGMGRLVGILTLNALAREAAHPHSRLKDGMGRVVYALAAIARPRTAARRAA